MVLHRFRMALLGYLVNSSFGKNSNQSSAEFHLPREKGTFSSLLAQAVVGSHCLLSVSVHTRQECTGTELEAVGPGPHSSPHPSALLAPVPLLDFRTPPLSLMMHMLPWTTVVAMAPYWITQPPINYLEQSAPGNDY